MKTEQQNPIRDLLDEIGLPWRLSRQELELRFGVTRHPAYDWDVVQIQTERPLVSGLFDPLSFNVHRTFAPPLPVIYFSGHSWFSNDARENLRRTTSELAAGLGPPPRKTNGNSISSVWRSGASSLTLTVWPEDLQTFPIWNPAHKRDRRLASACSITIETGFRLPVALEEEAWLNSFVGIDALPLAGDVTPQTVLNEPTSGYVLEFVRHPVTAWPSLFGQIGFSENKEVLIFCSDQLCVVPAKDILGFRTDRILPAKGSGGAFLYVTCKSEIGLAEMKSIRICQAPGPDDLNALTERIARALDKPFELGLYDHDC